MKKLSSDNSTRLLRWAVPALFAAFFIWLAAQIPYAHDDWDWGIGLGMRQLIYATVNSRYAGNLLEVILTRSEAAKCLIMGLTFLALPLAAVWVTPGANEIVLPRFPYAGYLHGATPVGEEKLMYFKEFYGIPQDVDVLFD